jgi:hypothetical protein
VDLLSTLRRASVYLALGRFWSPATELPPLRPAYGEQHERAKDVGEDHEHHVAAADDATMAYPAAPAMRPTAVPLRTEVR